MKRIALVFLTISLLLGNLFAFAGFDDIFASEDPVEETKKMNFSVSGSVGATVGFYFNDQVFSEQLLRLNLLADSPSFKSEAALSFDAHQKELKADTISITSFFDWGFIKAGLLKEEWGSGDGVHVVDVLNAFDYSKGLSDDIFSMKRAEFMVTSTIYKDQSSLQLYVKPTYTPGLASMKDKDDDRWSLLPKLPPPFSTFTFNDSPKTNALEYAQFGLRGRTSFSGIDLGLIYYRGHMAQPGFEPDFGTSTFNIVYTPYQLFGAEATYVLGQFTFMAEGGYMLSKDKAGTDPTLYNSKWVYLGGVSYLEPSSQLYVALMYNGHYIQNFDEVENNSLSGLDVDMMQAFDGKAYGNTITLAMEMPLFRERVNMRLGATYQIESEGFALLPSVSWQVSDDLKLECKAVVYGGTKGGIFETWKDNDYMTIGITHFF